jgi:hypothetical protein
MGLEFFSLTFGMAQELLLLMAKWNEVSLLSFIPTSSSPVRMAA